MFGQGPFFSTPPFQAEKYLIAFKSGICNGQTNVLLVALQGAAFLGSENTSKLSKYHVRFSDICKSVFQHTKATVSNLTKDDTPSSFACAWYQRDEDSLSRIRLAAERIREVLVADSDRMPAYYSIARNELAAFMQITTSEKDEVVTDGSDLTGATNYELLFRAGKLMVEGLEFSSPTKIREHLIKTV